MATIRPIVRLFVFLVTCLCLVPSWTVAQSSSTNYVLKQHTVSSAGQEASSAGYALGASAGQEATIGTSSSPRFVLQSGFWSFAGSGLVPVILAVDKSPVT